MAYQEVEMWEILDVLRRVGRGETKAAILQEGRRSEESVVRTGSASRCRDGRGRS